MARSAAILINQKQVALIERKRKEKTYYLFPGGTVEDGEALEDACIREIKEELGLTVKVKQLLCEVIFKKNHQYYYICEIEGGVFGTGDGEEYSGHLPPEDGTYTPVWMNLSDIHDNDVQPACICEMIHEYLSGQFSPRIFRDLGNGVCVPADSES